MELVCVPPEQVARAWPIAQPLLASAVREHGDWTLPELWDGLQNVRMLLWFVVATDGVRAAVITQLVDHPDTGRTCWVVACGGTDLNEWHHLLGRIEQFARDESCSRIRMSGRKGWAKVFPDYRQPFITLEKAL